MRYNTLALDYLFNGFYTEHRILNVSFSSFQSTKTQQKKEKKLYDDACRYAPFHSFNHISFLRVFFVIRFFRVKFEIK